MAGRILGMGDMLTLIEQAEQAFEKEQAEEAAGRAARGPVHARRLPRADAAAQEDGPARRPARDDAGHAQGAEERRDRRRPAQAGRGDHPLDDPAGAAASPELINGSRRAAHRQRSRHDDRRGQPPRQAVHRDAEDDEADGRDGLEEGQATLGMPGGLPAGFPGR